MFDRYGIVRTHIDNFLKYILPYRRFYLFMFFKKPMMNSYPTYVFFLITIMIKVLYVCRTGIMDTKSNSTSTNILCFISELDMKFPIEK